MYPWKFCIHLYVGFAEQHWALQVPCCATAAHILHLLMGRNQYPHCYICFNAELYDLRNSAGIPLQWPYYSITKSVYYMHTSIFLMCNRERHSANTSAQWRTTTPVKCNNQTEDKSVTVMLACYIMLVLYLIIVINQTAVYGIVWFLLEMTSRICSLSLIIKWWDTCI